MKITAELLELSASFTNCLKERELDLRGNRIPQMENLAITRDRYDTVDLSNNELRVLGSFPTLQNLRSLYAANNQLARIDEDMAGRLPNLAHLVLTNNRFEDLQSLQNLAHFQRLETLSVLDNIVSKRPDYRLYVVAKCPSLRFLDFSKVTAAEREEALAKFGAKEGKRGLDSEDLPMARPSKRTKNLASLSEDQKDVLRTAVAAASSLDEIARLERLLQSGVVSEEALEVLKNARK